MASDGLILNFFLGGGMGGRNFTGGRGPPWPPLEQPLVLSRRPFRSHLLIANFFLLVS